MRELFFKISLPFFMALLISANSPVRAQTDPAATPPTATEQAPRAKAPPREIKYYYERPTREKFSRLYWVMDMLDLNDDAAIDNFLMINECDIYKDYYFNEFEWKKIRESGRKFLEENKDSFPIRFEIVQPLFLGEYDTATKSFDVIPEYQVKETRRMEILPDNYTDKACLDDGSGRIPIIDKYPGGVIAEFNRPINITKIPVPPDLAKYYIEEKLKSFKKLGYTKQTQDNLYNTRDAYIFMHIKFFANKGTTTRYDSYTLTDMMAILEGMEVYADRDKKVLLWKQDFRKGKASRDRAKEENKSVEKEEAVIKQETGAAPLPAPIANSTRLQ
jgi:hypothetical protein